MKYDILSVGQKVRFCSSYGLKIISSKFLNENPTIARYYGITDGNPEVGEIIEVNIKKKIEWTNTETGESDGETIIRHDCRVRWPNGFENCFNSNNLRVYF